MIHPAATSHQQAACSIAHQSRCGIIAAHPNLTAEAILMIFNGSTMTVLQLSLCFVVVLSSFASSSALTISSRDTSSIQVVDLRCEYKVNPLGIDSPAPRLSWRLEGTGRSIAQTTYQIRVAETEAALRVDKSLLWDSGETRPSDSVQVP